MKAIPEEQVHEHTWLGEGSHMMMSWIFRTKSKQTELGRLGDL